MTTDVTLDQDKGYYDIAFTESGDIATDQSLDTAILMSIFEEARASSSEIPQSNLRRGWIGNESTDGFDQGSKSWEFEQERITGTTLAELGVVIRNALEWMITDGIAVSVEVEQPFLSNGNVSVFINFGRTGSKVEKRFYELWQNSGNF